MSIWCFDIHYEIITTIDVRCHKNVVKSSMEVGRIGRPWSKGTDFLL